MSDLILINSFRGEFEFLSNFYPSPVLLEDTEFPTVEHAYQAAKTLDPCERDVIARMRTPGAAKRAGRTVILRENWDSARIPVMRHLLRQKFSPTGILWGWLRDTAPAELVEGNSWGDRFWGMCNGTGQNHLGRLLMEIRGHSFALSFTFNEKI